MQVRLEFGSLIPKMLKSGLLGQLIAETYDLLKNLGGLTNEELAQVSGLIRFVSLLTRENAHHCSGRPLPIGTEASCKVSSSRLPATSLPRRTRMARPTLSTRYLLSEGSPSLAHTRLQILDKTGMKGTGQWTVMEAVGWSVPLGTISAALDARSVC